MFDWLIISERQNNVFSCLDKLKKKNPLKFDMWKACLRPVTFLGADPVSNDPQDAGKFTTINKQIILLSPVPSI